MRKQPIAEMIGVKNDLSALNRLFRKGIGVGIGRISFEEIDYRKIDGIDTEFERHWSVVITGSYFSLPKGRVEAIQVGSTLKLYFYPNNERIIDEFVEAVQKIKHELYEVGMIKQTELIAENVISDDRHENQLDKKIIPASSGEQKTELINKIDAYFDEDELKDIVLELDIEYENLPVVGKRNKIRELVIKLERLNRVQELIEICERERSKISWLL